MVVTLILSVLTAVPRPPLSRVLKYWNAINLLLFALSIATTYMLKMKNDIIPHLLIISKTIHGINQILIDLRIKD